MCAWGVRTAGGQTLSSEGGRRYREGEDGKRTSEVCRKASKVGTKGVHRAWQADPLFRFNVYTPAFRPTSGPSEGAHLQDFIDGFAVHGLLVVGGLVESTTEGAQWHQLFNTYLKGQPPPRLFLLPQSSRTHQVPGNWQELEA